jgi:hypothetical protein
MVKGSFALILVATFCMPVSSQAYSNYSSGQHALDIIQASLTGHVCALFGLRHFLGPLGTQCVLYLAYFTLGSLGTQ